MEWTGLNELRELYLSFFESKGHLRAPSASLVPKGDASLLLINSGMAPMKKFFTGEATPPCVRMTTCQKCIRTPDIESVGITARHGTYFEMLGNFSFGEYFKREAIAWAWEFFTDMLKMDPEKLHITVFEQDNEAWDIWTKEVGVAEDHMSRLGRKDNFWEHGKGPCGPCSEIHYDRGEQYGCGAPDCAPGCECDRFMEVWNLVFTQFNSDGAGNYTELDRKNIDTGMGLERLACVMQGVDNLFEVDTMQSIMRQVMQISGVQYHDDKKHDISLRVITDHARSSTMMISDGVLPGNEGRGYVLRRLLRRAARHGKLLGIERPFLAEVAETVIKENCGAYPQLSEKRDFILKVIANEEESFDRTIDAGMQQLSKMTADCAGELPGADAFKLSDTYGFPIDLTKEILAEKGMTVDEAGFKDLAAEQRERSRAARKEAGGWDYGDYAKAVQGMMSSFTEVFKPSFSTEQIPNAVQGMMSLFAEVSKQTKAFIGYELDEAEAKVLAVDGDIVVLDRTPFYAESGGQCGDSGTIGEYEVVNTTKTPEGVFLHHMAGGFDLAVGETVTAKVSENRAEIRANHTAAHLLQAALRKVLGSHVEQAGQSVTAQSLRFDFTHFSAMTKEELEQVEQLVNEAIWAAVPVETEELPIEEAKARGAIALFGEKYGDTVRMVSVPGYSTELCGGTHAANTGNLGMFLITGESSVASGVRRIEAVTRGGVAAQYQQRQAAAQERADLLQKQLKEEKKHVIEMKRALARHDAAELISEAKQTNGLLCVMGEIDCDAEGLREAGDIVKQRDDAAVALLACKTDKGLQFVATATPEAMKMGIHAGKIVMAAAAAAGGKGGGKPDSAMGGGTDQSKLDDAFAAGNRIINSLLGLNMEDI